MTTEERLAKVERELGRAKRRNRWLIAVVALAIGVWILAGTLGPTTAAAPAGAAASEPQRLPRYQIAVCENAVGPYVMDTYTGDIFMAPDSKDARQRKEDPSKFVQHAWYKFLDGPPR
ncbi:MAG: hypothetical protein IMZ66_01215 [Planctomycetes bacterium]|nr:hypothetical protein [Planctomycetota bacterium]